MERCAHLRRAADVRRQVRIILRPPGLRAASLPARCDRRAAGGVLDRAVARLAAGGSRAVFLGLNIPGARAAVIPAAGLAKMGFALFMVATIAGSLVFYGWHVALGYLAGSAATALFERYSFGVLAVLVLLSLAGLVVWLLMRRRDAGVRSWIDAACPACLAIAAARGDQA